MRQRLIGRLASFLAALSLAFAPALSAAAENTARPPHVRPEASTEEGGVWFVFDRAEIDARGSGELETDPALNAYVRNVVCRVSGEYCSDLRVYVMNRPFFNASAGANGYVEVWSGFMLRATNEAEFAFVLGHEFNHFLMNHSLQRQRAIKARSDLAMVISVGIAIAGVSAVYNADTAQIARQIMDATQDLINIVYLAAAASLLAYNRDQEYEADRLGQDRLVSAGYDPGASITIWQSNIAERRASDFSAVRNAQRGGSLFSTHPIDDERIQALNREMQARGASGGDLGRERYRAAIRPFLGGWLRDDLRRRDYGQTLYLIDRLAAANEDMGVLNYYRGECYRLRRNGDDLMNAVKFYELAVTFPDVPLVAWRELGNLSMQTGNPSRAREAYAEYLRLAPGAEDAWLIESSLKKLSVGGAQ